MSKLVVFRPDGTMLDVPLTRERTSIGRRAGNDVVLPNLAVSGEHAVVVTILADSFLEDLNSTNGTLVNGETVAKHFLRDRDEIDIGRHKLVYCADDEANLASEKPRGTTHVNERDFGGRVETAKAFVTGQAKNDVANTPAEPSRVSSGPAGANAVRKRTVGSAKTERPVGPPSASLIEPPEPEEGPAATMPLAALRLSGPGVKLLTGYRAGAAFALTKAETTLGRPGIQVAAIIHADGRFRLKPLEGIAPPAVNGQPVGADGTDLVPGDIIEVAGGRVEFVDSSATSAGGDTAS